MLYLKNESMNLAIFYMLVMIHKFLDRPLILLSIYIFKMLGSTVVVLALNVCRILAVIDYIASQTKQSQQ